jgi:DNA processing protein
MADPDRAPNRTALIDWLRLARSENVGPVTFAELVSRYGDATRALAAIPDLARRGGRAVSPHVATVREAEAELAAGEALGARLLITRDADFPPLLAALDPPPPVIWARGDLKLLQRPAVAIVGARIASASGQSFARTLARQVAEAGYPVVSGMARGIDGAAHDGALSGGTVAVLGGGIDDIYPPEHAGLYDRLVAQGCVVSERPPGAVARAADFPRRNRLISGLSLAVVVVEAELRSGSLITARMAGEQGREVLAVPGSPLDPRARGTNDLIRQGAAVCEGIDDVLRTLEGLGGLREPSGPGFEPAPFEDADHALIERVAALLSYTPTLLGELARAAAAPTPLVYAALTELTLAGRAELLPGGLVVRAG